MADASATREVDLAALEGQARKAESRRGFLVGLPAWIYLFIFFAIPLVIVFIYSLATRTSTGQTVLTDFNFDAWKRIADPLVLQIAWRSLSLALLTTLISLLIAYPFAYYIATRSRALRNLLLVFVMIPFWSNFLVRTYAWRVLLGSDGIFSQFTEAIGLGETRLLFTNTAVLIGMVYGFLPFMVLPLYASIERMDWRLVEAARDLYGTGWAAFRRVTLPLSRPGVVAGCILVFIPAIGAYVTPAILGGATTTLLGQYIVDQFQTARNWPFGSALSFAIMTVMLMATIVYFRVGGRNL